MATSNLEAASELGGASEPKRRLKAESAPQNLKGVSKFDKRFKALKDAYKLKAHRKAKWAPLDLKGASERALQSPKGKPEPEGQPRT